MTEVVFQSAEIQQLTVGNTDNISGSTVVKKGTIGMSGADLQYFNGSAWKRVENTDI